MDEKYYKLGESMKYEIFSTWKLNSHTTIWSDKKKMDFISDWKATHFRLSLVFGPFRY